MFYAINKYTGLLVEASKALPPRKGYICPKCFAGCHLRKGLKQKPHFAHDSGRASVNCENYHPTKALSKDSNWSILRHSPRLYVCEEDGLGANSLSWKLMLLIPECPQGTGSVKITQGYHGTVIIPVAHLSRGGQRVNVRPQVNYQIGVNGQVDYNYQKKITGPIPGLSKKFYNLFHYAPTGGRKLHNNQVLLWGRSYYLVWYRSFEPEWWPSSKVLWRRTLNPNCEWYCTIIEFPSEEDYQVRKWAENVLHKRVEKPPATLSLMTPIVIRQFEDESLLIPVVEEAILGITGELGTAIPSELHLQLSSNVISVVKLHGPFPIIVSLGQLPPGRTEIWLPEKPDVALSLCAVEVEQGYHPQGVGFVIEETLLQRQVFAPVYSLLARSLLEDVQQGHNSLVAVTIPRRVSTNFRVRRQSDTLFEELLIEAEYSNNEEVNSLKHKEYEERVQQEIVARLAEYQGKLEINFKNYGKVKLDLNRVLKSKILAFQPHRRRQLEWILSVLQSRNPRNSFLSRQGMKQLQRFLEQIPIDQLNASDRLLINRLLKNNCVPVTLEAHLRAIAKHIRKALIETDINL